MQNVIHYTRQIRHTMTAENLAIIIEDEEAHQIMYSRLVALQGYETLLASNGREAMELLSKHTPTVIFLDMMLPYISGETILHYLAGAPRFANTHIVIMSANIEFRIYESIVKGSEFHLKPLLPSHFEDIFKRLNKPLAS